MLYEKLHSCQLVLASSSPRRQQFLKELGLPFEIRLRSVEEIYPQNLKAFEVAEYLAKLKASAFSDLQANEILITGDTVVSIENQILGKPKNKEEAFEMLRMLSGEKHEVVSSICLKSLKNINVDHDVTKVYFKKLSEEEIEFYIKNFQPFDKAGAYGIQEWIGQIGIEKIEGSYFNVMGMPTHLLYKMLQNHIES
ncbi:MAG TPA: Maf family nucleotide pyrophosphatase [Flavobacteriaceae bacterium]|nr:Maf family nucleotide pyrophosphatase [Flavobacteriaceae bacterium]